jgi:hypothetical protein
VRALGRAELVRLLGDRDPLAAARVARRQLAQTAGANSRGNRADREALVDGDQERPVEDHRAAHAAGRPSEAALSYGAGVPVEHTADRLLALAALARETGLLRTVRPVPGPGGPKRPGSWGVEDATVIAAARAVLPPGVAVLADEALVGRGMSEVAVAFGASG